MITNGGGGIENGRFTLNLYASPQPYLDPSAVMIVSVGKMVKLKPGAAKPFPIKLPPLPTTLPGGYYYLLAQVIDSSGTAYLTPTASTMLVAAPYVSLSAAVRAATPSTVPVGKGGNVTVAITNSGNVPAAGQMTITLVPLPPPTAQRSPSSLLTPSRRTSSIKPGKTRKCSRLHFIPPFPAAAGYLLSRSVRDSERTAGDGAIAFGISLVVSP